MPTRTERAANQTVLGASKVSSSFTAPSGDKIVVCAAAGDESGDGTFDLTITDSIGLTWAETTVVNVTSNDAALSIFTATSTGASMTVTVAATGATAIGFRVDSVSAWAAVTNAATGTVDYGTATVAVTYGSGPATDSLCMACAHDQQPNYDHGTGLLNTPSGWSLIEFIEFQHATDRWLQLKVYDRTGSASTSAGTDSTTAEHDSLSGAAIEITAAVAPSVVVDQMMSGRRRI